MEPGSCPYFVGQGTTNTAKQQEQLKPQALATTRFPAILPRHRSPSRRFQNRVSQVESCRGRRRKPRWHSRVTDAAIVVDRHHSRFGPGYHRRRIDPGTQAVTEHRGSPGGGSPSCTGHRRACRCLTAANAAPPDRSGPRHET